MRYSHQRELVLEAVKSVKTHPTADMVYDSLREENPHLSLGTVYRNLSSKRRHNSDLYGRQQGSL